MGESSLLEATKVMVAYAVGAFSDALVAAETGKSWSVVEEHLHRAIGAGMALVDRIEDETGAS